MKVKSIPIELIKYPNVMLRSPEDMTGIDDLAQSIETDGLLNPLTVLQKGEDYELLAGGRRLKAVRKLGWEKVPCNVISPVKERERIITLIENQKRDELNPLEEAQYYEYLQKELHLSQEKIGELSGTTAAHVNQMLKLLTLDEFTMGALAIGDISSSQARELARCSDISYRQYLVDIIRKSGASVLVLKRWVDQRIGFVSQRAEEQVGAFIEPSRAEREAEVTQCEICGRGLEYGGLQSLMCCNECYQRLKQAMEGESVSQGRGENK